MGAAAMPIVLRAKLTAGEYVKLRQLALERNEAVHDTVAAAIRKTYPTITERQAK